MPTSDCGFQLGLIPEKKWNWRTFAASYGMLTGLILFFLVVGVVVPDTLLLDANYHITELIPRPALRPERLHKSKPLHMKLLPPAPVFETPKLIVPHEVRAAQPQQQGNEPPTEGEPAEDEFAAAAAGVRDAEADRAARGPRGKAAAAGN